MVNSRRKGVRGELEARDLWREFYPECERSFGQARKGYEQPDLIGGGIENDWYVEVKRVKVWPTTQRIWDWMDKALNDAMEYQQSDPTNVVLMCRQNGNKEWVLWYKKDDNHDWVKSTWQDFVLLYIRASSPPRKEL